MYAMSSPGPRKVPPIFCFESKISIRSACRIFPPGRMNPSTYPRMGASSLCFGMDDDDDDDCSGGVNAIAVPRYPGPLAEKLSFIPFLDAKVVISSMSAIGISSVVVIEDDDDADKIIIDDDRNDFTSA